MSGAAKPARKRPPSRAAAARAETTTPDQPRTVESHGLTLTLPDTFPPAVFMDMVEGEASEGGANAYLINLRTLRSLVGGDQFTEIRHAIGNEPDKVEALIGDVLNSYGLSAGESEASPGS